MNNTPSCINGTSHSSRYGHVIRSFLEVEVAIGIAQLMTVIYNSLNENTKRSVS